MIDSSSGCACTNSNRRSSIRSPVLSGPACTPVGMIVHPDGRSVPAAVASGMLAHLTASARQAVPEEQLVGLQQAGCPGDAGWVGAVGQPGIDDLQAGLLQLGRRAGEVREEGAVL